MSSLQKIFDAQRRFDSAIEKSQEDLPDGDLSRAVDSVATGAFTQRHEESRHWGELRESFEDVTSVVEIASNTFETSSLNQTEESTVPNGVFSGATTAIAIMQVVRGFFLKKESGEKTDTSEFTKSSLKIGKGSSELLSSLSSGAIKIISSLPSSGGLDLATKILGISSLTGLSGAALTLLGISAININETSSAYQRVKEGLNGELDKAITALQSELQVTEKEKDALIKRICEEPSFVKKATSFLEEANFKKIFGDTLSCLREPSIYSLQRVDPTQDYQVTRDPKKLPASWQTFLDAIQDATLKEECCLKLNFLLDQGLSRVVESELEKKEAIFDRTFGKGVRLKLKEEELTEVEKRSTIDLAKTTIKKNILLSLFKMISSILFSALVVFGQIATAGLLEKISSVLSLVVPSLFILTEVFKSSESLKEKFSAIIDGIVNFTANIKRFFTEDGKLEKVKTLLITALKDLMTLTTLMLGVIFYFVGRYASGVVATTALAVVASLSLVFLIYSFIDHEVKVGKKRAQKTSLDSGISSSI